MDPFTALGASAAIVQFVEFGGNLLSDSYEIYKSASGASADNTALEDMAKHLSILSDKLDISSRTSLPGLSKEEQALAQLAGKCRAIANELLSILQQLKTSGTSHRKWKSFRQALKTVRKQGDIDSLQKRLDKYGNQLNLHLAAIIR